MLSGDLSYFKTTDIGQVPTLSPKVDAYQPIVAPKPGNLMKTKAGCTCSVAIYRLDKVESLVSDEGICQSDTRQVETIMTGTTIPFTFEIMDLGTSQGLEGDSILNLDT